MNEQLGPSGAERQRQRRAMRLEGIKTFLRENPNAWSDWPEGNKKVDRWFRLAVVQLLKQTGVVAKNVHNLDIPLSRCIREIRAEDQGK